MQHTPVISTKALYAVPEFVRTELGPKVLARAIAAAGLDFEWLEDEDCFVPQKAVLTFLDEIARGTGDDRFGLCLTPHMTVSNYGIWADYVLGASTLEEGIRRCVGALRYHSTGDALGLRIEGGEAALVYLFGLAGHPGYDQVACGAAGVIQSFCRAFHPSGWLPKRIELNIRRPRKTMPFEDLFRCPVLFDAPALAVVFDRASLSRRLPRQNARPTATIEDVIRARRGGAPTAPLDVVREHIRAQVLTGSVTIRSAALAMDVSVRTLQRQLQHAGTDFRSMVNDIRARRAIELLRGTGLPVTTIALDLGYSSPDHFTRALRKVSGKTPRAFRQQVPKGAEPDDQKLQPMPITGPKRSMSISRSDPL